MPMYRLAPAGKDLRTVEACEATFQEIDDVVGLEYLRVNHTSFLTNHVLLENDSIIEFMSHSRACLFAAAVSEP